MSAMNARNQVAQAVSTGTAMGDALKKASKKRPTKKPKKREKKKNSGLNGASAKLAKQLSQAVDDGRKYAGIKPFRGSNATRVALFSGLVVKMNLPVVQRNKKGKKERELIEIPVAGGGTKRYYSAKVPVKGGVVNLCMYGKEFKKAEGEMFVSVNICQKVMPDGIRHIFLDVYPVKDGRRTQYRMVVTGMVDHHPRENCLIRVDCTDGYTGCIAVRKIKKKPQKSKKKKSTKSPSDLSPVKAEAARPKLVQVKPKAKKNPVVKPVVKAKK